MVPLHFSRLSSGLTLGRCPWNRASCCSVPSRPTSSRSFRQHCLALPPLDARGVWRGRGWRAGTCWSHSICPLPLPSRPLGCGGLGRPAWFQPGQEPWLISMAPPFSPISTSSHFCHMCNTFPIFNFLSWKLWGFCFADESLTPTHCSETGELGGQGDRLWHQAGLDPC